MRIGVAAIFVLVAVTTFQTLLADEAADQSTAAVVLRIDQDTKSKRMYCTVNDTKCRKPESKIESQVLSSLQHLEAKKGDPRVVAIIISNQISLETAGMARVMAQKAGFDNVRTFLDDPDTKRVVEVLFGDRFIVRVSQDRAEIVRAH